MAIIFGLLSVVLVLDCIVLIFLVLLQLPKKEAGMGTAFGGGAADALFGAGSGNALTMITRYSAIVFFSVSLIMAVITTRGRAAQSNAFEEALDKPGQAQSATIPATGASNDFLMSPLGVPAASNAAPSAPSNAVTPTPAAPTPKPSSATNR